MRPPANEQTPGTTRIERGASATEYALLLSAFVLSIMGAIQLITDNASDLLEDTGVGIGTDRPTRDVVVDLPVTPPPSWPPATIASDLLTYVEKPIQISDGSCLILAGPAIATVDCSDAGVALASAL
ncbi:MAG: hypothetical protein AAF547_23265, partial [Actinomycetota bacterium]